MATCWTPTSNGPGLDSAEIINENGGGENGAAVDVSHSLKDKSKLKCMFEQLFSEFVKVNREQGIPKLMPATLGDGREIDLFKLFWAVNEKQGFDFVDKNRLWASVLQDLHLSLMISPSIKLIYMKYLYQLEKWCRISFESTNLEFEACINEVGAEFRGLFLNGSDQTMKNSLETDVLCDDAEKIANENDYRTENPEVAVQELNFRKRKRDALVNMLNWVAQIAKFPRDPSIGPIPDISKRKPGVSHQIWSQAIRAREALFSRRHAYSTIEESALQKNQKMHPSMYENVIVRYRKPTEKLKSSKQLPTLVKPRTRKTQWKKGPKAPPRKDFIPLTHTRVGPRFQTEVPVWTGLVTESDSKWLGTRVWPLEQEKNNTTTESTGKGRQDLCTCRVPDSVECIRFHIVENRMKLKLELGPVFYRWQFDQMGEEVTLRWTSEEEKRFKDLMKSKPSFLAKGFCNGMSRWFPEKTRENLISYYFNVFMLERRRYQNRVHFTPKDIQSDDDKTELGSVGVRYGDDAIKVAGSDILICSHNRQSFDYR